MERQRRLFFKQTASSAIDLFHSLVSQRRSKLTTPTPMDSQIAGDLTPELLAMEAERLGLDPEKDRHIVCQTIQAAMGRPGKKQTAV